MRPENNEAKAEARQCEAEIEVETKRYSKTTIYKTP